MSEGNERNLENIAPEASENIQPENAAKEPRRDAERKPVKRGAAIALAVVLALALVALAVVVGYGLGRGNGGGNVEAAPSETATEAPEEDEAEIPAYDAFTEELTGENQQALDALAGADGGDNGAGALLGEEGLFGDDALVIEDEEGEAVEVEQPAAEPVVVAEFGDGQQLMSDEVLEAYNEVLSMYILSGYSEDEVAEVLLDDVLRTMVSERVLAAHARELGVYENSEEDLAAIEEEAKAVYNEYVDYYRANIVSAEGMSEEDAEAAAKAYLLEYEGVNYMTLLEEIQQGWWEQKLYDEVTAEVTIDDADVEAEYASRLVEQKENFTEYPDDYEFYQMNGETIVYNLPGYRAVKQLLLGFGDDDTAMAVYMLNSELADADDAARAARQEELDALYAAPEAKAQDALKQLEAGVDIDELILTVGADEGMRDDRQREMGYYVSGESVLWPQDVVDAVMALENVGDYSQPVRTEEGVCIFQYIGDVAEGEVPLASVREALAAETLDDAKYEAFEAQVEAWIAEANPSYYPERMQ